MWKPITFSAYFQQLWQPLHITLPQFCHRSTLTNALGHWFRVLALSRHRLWPHTSPYQTHYMDGRYDIVSGEFNHQFWSPLHPLSSITLTNTFMKHRGGRGGSGSMHHGHFTTYSPHPTWSRDDEFVQPSLSSSSEAGFQSRHLIKNTHKRSN